MGFSGAPGLYSLMSTTKSASSRREPHPEDLGTDDAHGQKRSSTASSARIRGVDPDGRQLFLGMVRSMNVFRRGGDTPKSRRPDDGIFTIGIGKLISRRKRRWIFDHHPFLPCAAPGCRRRLLAIPPRAGDQRRVSPSPAAPWNPPPEAAGCKPATPAIPEVSAREGVLSLAEGSTSRSATTRHAASWAQARSAAPARPEVILPGNRLRRQRHPPEGDDLRGRVHVLPDQLRTERLPLLAPARLRRPLGRHRGGAAGAIRRGLGAQRDAPDRRARRHELLLRLRERQRASRCAGSERGRVAEELRRGQRAACGRRGHDRRRPAGQDRPLPGHPGTRDGSGPDPDDPRPARDRDRRSREHPGRNRRAAPEHRRRRGDRIDRRPDRRGPARAAGSGRRAGGGGEGVRAHRNGALRAPPDDLGFRVGQPDFLREPARRTLPDDVHRRDPALGADLRRIPPRLRRPPGRGGRQGREGPGGDARAAGDPPGLDELLQRANGRPAGPDVPRPSRERGAGRGRHRGPLQERGGQHPRSPDLPAQPRSRPCSGRQARSDWYQSVAQLAHYTGVLLPPSPPPAGSPTGKETR